MTRQFSGLTLASPLVILMTMTAPALADTVLRRANDLSFGGSESLDPISANRFYEVNDLIYSRLIRQGDDGRPAPELAQTWTANDTATEWTLTLQPGVTLHDDSTFDAADVKFTLERIKDPALESPVTDVLGFIDGVDIVDPLTAKIRLSTPHAGLPLLLMDYRVRILPEGAAEPFGIGLPPWKVVLREVWFSSPLEDDGMPQKKHTKTPKAASRMPLLKNLALASCPDALHPWRTHRPLPDLGGQ